MNSLREPQLPSTHNTYCWDSVMIRRRKINIPCQRPNSFHLSRSDFPDSGLTTSTSWHLFPKENIYASTEVQKWVSQEAVWYMRNGTPCIFKNKWSPVGFCNLDGPYLSKQISAGGEGTFWMVSLIYGRWGRREVNPSDDKTLALIRNWELANSFVHELGLCWGGLEVA